MSPYAGEMPEPVDLCVLLWAVPGRLEELIRYEDRVLALVADHGGRVVDRLRNLGEEGPSEVQVLHFASQESLDSYMNDPRRLVLAGDRDRSVARTEVLSVRRA
jgi:uncharacterized protein (DUF1330 family)